MGVRELVEKQKRWVIPAVVVGIAACAYSAWRTHRSTVLPGIVERAYYSDDDGQTYFADDMDKGFCFDHDGKKAYRAFVYRCGSGKPFVGLLAKTLDQPTTAATSDSVAARYKGQKGPPPPMEVKKPGGSKWILSASPEGQALVQSLCPDGAPEVLLP